MCEFIVTVRMCPTDISYLCHFFSYYKKLGVSKFLINFNSKLDTEEKLNEFINFVIGEYQNYNIIYNIGPNGINNPETFNINMLKDLVKMYTTGNDYIIPCDADEFHEYEFSFEDCLKIIKMNNYNYIGSCTKERYSSDGIIKNILPDNNIFEQFDKFSFKLNCMPKISLIEQQFFFNLGVGHHNISKDAEKIKKSNIKSYTNHFRWCKEGKLRMECWLKLWKSENYKGWKGIEKYESQLMIFDDILKYAL